MFNVIPLANHVDSAEHETRLYLGQAIIFFISVDSDYPESDVHNISVLQIMSFAFSDDYAEDIENDSLEKLAFVGGD